MTQLDTILRHTKKTLKVHTNKYDEKGFRVEYSH